jgi:hypothetical protein
VPLRCLKIFAVGCLLACLLCGGAAQAAHTYDTKAQTATWTNANPTTLSYTCGAGTTLLTLKIQHTQTARTGGAPTFNSAPFSQAGAEVLNAQEVGVEVWYLKDPPTGSAYTISVPNGAAGSMRITAASFKAQSGYTSGLFNVASDNVDKGSTTLTINSVPAGAVCLDVLGHGYLNPPSARSHTLLYTNDEGALTFETQYGLIAGAGNVTMTHTVGGSDDVANRMACFQEVLPAQSYAYTMTGGGIGGGTSPNSHGTAYAYTMSGGGISGGAASLLRGILRLAVGGGISGGAATIATHYESVGQSYSYTMAGGGLGGGASPNSHGVAYSYTMAGGGITGGAASYSRSRAATMTGGGIAGGSSPNSHGTAYAYTMTGGGISGGAASYARSFVFSMLGGGITGGAATFITHSEGAASYFYTMSGGGISGGAAALVRGILRAAVGGGISGGAATYVPGSSGFVPGKQKTKKIEIKGFRYLR